MLILVFDTPEKRDKFQLLYQKNYHLVFYILNSIVHDSHAAEDLTHDTFLKLSRHMHKFKTLDSPATHCYIITTAKHLAYDYLKKVKNNSCFSIETVNDSIFIDDNIMTFCIENEEYEILLALIANLKDIYKIPLQLKYISGLSTREIAKILDLSPDTVKKRITRAKVQLQKSLNERKEINL